MLVRLCCESLDENKFVGVYDISMELDVVFIVWKWTQTSQGA